MLASQASFLNKKHFYFILPIFVLHTKLVVLNDFYSKINFSSVNISITKGGTDVLVQIEGIIIYNREKHSVLLKESVS